MYLGIEIGGTKLQLGVGRGDGSELIALERRDVDGSSGAERILAQIDEVGRSLVERFDIQRIGIGFGGPVDAARGCVTKSHQVAGWEGVPLARWCEERFHAPVVLANDSDAAALAEATAGAGRGNPCVLFITVGTGIGGGLVIDGRLHGSGRPAAAEIGHLRPGLDSRDVHETVESLASGPGLAARAATRIRATSGKDADDLFARCQDLWQLTPKILAAAAAQGNPLAADCLADACQVLGWAIAQAITLLAPNVVVVGGGVSLIGEQFFFEPLRAAVATYVFTPLANTYQIRPAAFGEEVVVQGAIVLGRKVQEGAGR